MKHLEYICGTIFIFSEGTNLSDVNNQRSDKKHTCQSTSSIAQMNRVQQIKLFSHTKYTTDFNFNLKFEKFETNWRKSILISKF